LLRSTVKIMEPHIPLLNLALSAHLHVPGVGSCYAVKPSALQKSDEPTWQSRKNSSLDDPYPSTTPDTVDAAAYLAFQPSVKLHTTRKSLRALRTTRQHALTAADAAANTD
jgi:hypothetical protein